MKDWVMPLQKEYFDAVSLGIKTIEGRVPNYSVPGKNYSEMQIGDKINFVCISTGKEIKKEVSLLQHFDSTKQFLETLGLEKTLPGVKSLEEGIKIYHNFPCYEERIKNNGIYAIFFK